MRRHLLLALCALPLLAGAQVYRWVDEQGKVHYTDKPPPEARARATDIESRPTDPEQVKAQEAAREARLEYYRKLRETDEKIEAAQAKRRAMEEARCRDARAWLEKLQGARRLYRVNEQGEREYYSAEEAAAAREQARADVEKYCG